MTAKDQEEFLVKKLTEVYAVEAEIRKFLATVRGGQRVNIPEPDERPDLIELKK
jgi:stage III sporulation protein SpoIIIAA